MESYKLPFSVAVLEPLKKVYFWFALVLVVVGLSIVQDYISSEVRNTGFYLSESLLYNSIWMYFLPLGWLQLNLLQRTTIDNGYLRWSLYSLLALAMTLVHLLLFTTVFVSMSALVFSPSHHFSAIFNTALTRQFFILATVYGLVVWLRKRPFLTTTSHSVAKETTVIKVKVGTKIISIPQEEIQYITTDKPYSAISVAGKKYLDSRSLKMFETMLTSEDFMRVHRSTLLNVQAVKELRSRKNGDYDVLLKHGEEVRLSRHYRINWERLLH